MFDVFVHIYRKDVENVEYGRFVISDFIHAINGRVCYGIYLHTGDLFKPLEEIIIFSNGRKT